MDVWEEIDYLKARVANVYDCLSAAGAEGPVPQTRSTYNLPNYISSIVAYRPPVYDALSGDLELGQVPLSIDLSYNSGAYLQDQLAYIAPENGLLTFVMRGNGITNGAIGRIKVAHGDSGTHMVVGEVAVKNDIEACVQALVRKGDYVYFQGDNTAHDTASGGLRLNAISASFYRL